MKKLVQLIACLIFITALSTGCGDSQKNISELRGQESTEPEGSIEYLLDHSTSISLQYEYDLANGGATGKQYTLSLTGDHATFTSYTEENKRGIYRSSDRSLEEYETLMRLILSSHPTLCEPEESQKATGAGQTDQKEQDEQDEQEDINREDDELENLEDDEKDPVLDKAVVILGRLTADGPEATYVFTPEDDRDIKTYMREMKDDSEITSYKALY